MTTDAINEVTWLQFTSTDAEDSGKQGESAKDHVNICFLICNISSRFKKHTYITQYELWSCQVKK